MAIAKKRGRPPKSTNKEEIVIRQDNYFKNVNFIREVRNVLNSSKDEVTKQFGEETLFKMLRDPIIFKCISLIKTLVLSDGIEIFPNNPKPKKAKKVQPLPSATNQTGTNQLPVELELSPSEKKAQESSFKAKLKIFEKSKEYSDLTAKLLSKMDNEKSLDSIMRQMLDAVYEGYKIAEKSYREPEYDPETKTYLSYYKNIRVLPRRYININVDDYSTFLGITGVNKNRERVFIDKRKLVKFTFNEKDEDPRGNTIFDAIYNAWYLKQQMFPEYLRWLVQCALPLLVATLPPDAKNIPVMEDDGVTPKLIDGIPVTISAVDKLLDDILEARNASGLALSHGSDVKWATSSVSGDPFNGMGNYTNAEMEQGILLQKLAASTEKNMTRSATGEHKDILDSFIFDIKEQLAHIIRFQIVKPVLEDNIKDFEVKYLPLVSLGDTERSNFTTDSQAIEGLWSVGYLTESQKSKTDKMLRLPERDEDE